MKKNVIYLLPLLFLQIYLAVTLLVFTFGPISYSLPLPVIFWLCIFCYHFAFFLGYLLAYMSKIKKADFSGKKEIGKDFNLRLFHVLLFFSFFSSLLGFKNVDSILDFFNPFFWFESALQGVLNPGVAYTEKMQRVSSDVSGNKLLNIFLFFIAFSKIVIVPFIVFLWSRLSFKVKIASLFVTLLPLLSSLSHGTNKGVFDFVILYGSSLMIFFVYNKYHFNSYMLRKRKFFLLVLIFSMLGALTFFGTAMSERGGDIRYIELIDPLGNIKVDESSYNKTRESFFYYTYAWLGSYIVQGYYGFGLALTQDFETSYGVGNSVFLTRNFESLLGVDLRENTFQYKINNWWGESSQWHSFYSFFANDFHFVGVAFVCFILSFLMAKAWFDFIDSANVFAGAMMPIFSVLIIFIPANNQIFGFLDGLSAFFWTCIFWFYSKNKFRFIRI